MIYGTSLGQWGSTNEQGSEIDKLYADIEAKGEIAPRTAHHVHTVFNACLGAAVRTGLISTNPMLRVQQVPNAELHVDDIDDEDHGDDIGEGLADDELRKLVDRFRRSTLSRRGLGIRDRCPSQRASGPTLERS